jgi:5-formyltetrahydrofolate cyclo-ligase
VKEEKALWREKMKTLREHYSSQITTKYSQEICFRIEELPLFQSAQMILFTAPISGEVNLLPLAEKYFSTKNICFPKIQNPIQNIIEARKICSLRQLSEKTFGILEPIEDTIPVSLDEIDLFLIPALAVDKEGNRLGMGKGFFDRFLKTRRGIALAVVFDGQIFEQIPTEPHDEKVDGIISEKQIFLF